MKALLIDDEPLARQEMRTLLVAHPEIEIIGEAASAKQAAKLIAQLQPDVIFLDVAMPGATGFDLLEKLPTPRPLVIFTTAYDTFAIRAFEVEAVDYLLKPVDPRRLRAALVRLAALFAARSSHATPSPKPSSATAGGKAKAGSTAAAAAAAASSATPAAMENDEPLAESDHVFVREGERCWFVPVRSIRLLEADGNHTQVHFDDQRPLLYRTLVSMEKRLPPKLFLRANRAQLVNLTQIASVGQWFSGSLQVTLRDGTMVEFSRRYAQLFRERTSL